MHGVNTYHKNQHVDMTDLMTDKFGRDAMIDKVQHDMAVKIHKSTKKHIDWRNKAYNIRTGHLQQKIAEQHAMEQLEAQ